MSLKIVPEACKIEPDSRLKIVIEGSGPEEVLSSEGKSLAVKHANACGYNNLGINGQSGSYPVDAEGKTYDDWNEQSRRNLIAAYRNEIFLMSGLR